MSRKTTDDRDALALAAAIGAMRNVSLAETVLPALRRRRGDLSRGTRAGIARCIDRALRHQREEHYLHADMDTAAWSSLRDALIEGDVREIYDAAAASLVTGAP